MDKAALQTNFSNFKYCVNKTIGAKMTDFQTREMRHGCQSSTGSPTGGRLLEEVDTHAIVRASHEDQLDSWAQPEKTSRIKAFQLFCKCLWS